MRPDGSGNPYHRPRPALQGGPGREWYCVFDISTGDNDRIAPNCQRQVGDHSEHVIAALKSGRHVYGEKTMAFTVDETKEIVKVAESGKTYYQVGHQYRYAPWIRAGVERVRRRARDRLHADE